MVNSKMIGNKIAEVRKVAGMSRAQLAGQAEIISVDLQNGHQYAALQV